MCVLGLDIHRAFAEAVAWDDGKPKRLGRVSMSRHLLEDFAMRLSKEDVVVVEATGNAASVAAAIAPHVERVVIANPKQVRVIAHAKIKTDTIDASVLAQLYASGFLPEVWVPDEPTQARRRQVTRRNQIVRQHSRLKSQTDLAGGRATRRRATSAQFDRLAEDLWHLLSKGESYVWERPSLHAKKLRDLELKAGHKPEREQKGAAHAYNIKSHRDQERR